MTVVAPDPAGTLGDPATDAGAGSRRAAGTRAGRAAVPVAVGVLAVLVYAVDLTRPSPWRDEVATIDAARRTVGGILALTRHVDAVHAAYYLLTRAVADVDPGPVRVLDGRLISLVALAFAAAGTVLIGRRTDGARSGLAAGLLLVVSPLASRFAAEARPFALATALAVAATLALLRALDRPSGPRWAAYGVALAALGAVETLALPLLLAAHAVHLAATAYARHLARPAGQGRPAPPAGPGRPAPPAWSAVRPWAVAAVAAVAVVAPLALVVTGQRGQLSALASPAPRDLADYAISAAGSRAGLVLLVAAAGAAVVLAARGRRASRGPADGRRPGVRPAAPWATAAAGWLLPLAWGVGLPVAVWLVSQVEPLFRDRYVLFTLPGIALLVGRVLTRLPLPLGVAVLLAVTGAGLPAQASIRGPGGHGEDIRALDVAVAGLRRPGDAVVFVPGSTARVVQLQPSVWAGLPDHTDRPSLPATRVLLVRRVAASHRPGADAPPTADRATLAAVAAGRRVTATAAVTGFTVTVYAAARGPG